MSGGAKRPRYRQVMQNSVKNGKWGKAGIMNCQFRSRRYLCNSIRSRAPGCPCPEVVYDAIPNIFREFLEIINDWIAGGVTRTGVEAKYGKIEDWDTSNVTSMKNLFHSKKTFNEDISKWNTSNVTDMGGMFHSSKAFNQPIDKWDVSNVLSMKCMFCDALAFDQNLGSWEPKVCTDFNSMFNGAFGDSQNNGDWTSTTTFKNTLDSRIAANATSSSQFSFFSDGSAGTDCDVDAKDCYSIGSTHQYPKLN